MLFSFLPTTQGGSRAAPDDGRTPPDAVDLRRRRPARRLSVRQRRPGARPVPATVRRRVPAAERPHHRRRRRRRRRRPVP